VACFNEHGTSRIGEVANAALGDSILMVRVDAAKRDGLIWGALHLMAEGFRSEDTIVSVVVFYGDAMLGSKTLEGAFGFDGFKCRRGFLGVNKV
jgi:hypothetical protein